MNLKSIGQILILAVLAIILAGFSKGQDTVQKESDAVVKAELLQQEKQCSEATRAKDRATMERCFADGLSWVARGDRLGKEQVIADFLSGNLHFQSVTHDHVQITFFGNTAVETGHSTSVLEYKGKLSNVARLFTTVYVKMDGRWQMVQHQVSDLGPQ